MRRLHRNPDHGGVGTVPVDACEGGVRAHGDQRAHRRVGGGEVRNLREFENFASQRKTKKNHMRHFSGLHKQGTTRKPSILACYGLASYGKGAADSSRQLTPYRRLNPAGHTTDWLSSDGKTLASRTLMQHALMQSRCMRAAHWYQHVPLAYQLSHALRIESVRTVPRRLVGRLSISER